MSKSKTEWFQHFLDVEHQAWHAARTERDRKLFKEAERAYKSGFVEAGKAPPIRRPFKPSEDWYTQQEEEWTLQRRPLLAIATHDAATVFYVGHPDARHEDRLFHRFIVQGDSQPTIASHEVLCQVCGGTGTTKSGGACAECSGRGWEVRSGGSIALGPATSVERVATPSDATSKAALDALQ